uniref:Uncharacterized protein n=1 Tax=Moniliophthora roreri TaxID=221103 RepID=A0A0W0G235_MONRR
MSASCDVRGFSGFFFFDFDWPGITYASHYPRTPPPS